MKCLDPNRPGGIKSVLFFCLPGIGDCLLMTPAMRALKKALPGVRISALTMFKGARMLLEHDPDVDEVLHFDFMNESKIRAWRFVMGLRRRRFDATILGYPANRLEYNAIAWLVRPRLRAGHRYNHLDMRCGNWLNTVTVREDDKATNTEENLRLVEALTGARSADTRVELRLTPEHEAFAEAWLTKTGMGERPLVGFHAGGSLDKNHINKRWPPEAFVALGRMVVADAGATVLVFGGPKEAELKGRLVTGIGTGAVSVETSNIMETAALVARCRHFVSNDTALMHLAGALGVPTSGIFGPTSAEWVRMPDTPRAEVRLGLPCQPCFYYSPRHLSCKQGDFRCLRELKPEQVMPSVLGSVQDVKAVTYEERAAND
jgi:ADP-heptose:LPS heptosyltransferase